MAKYIQQFKPLIKALREELRTLTIKLDSLRDAVVKQGEAVNNAEKTRDEYYQKHPPVIISELKIPDAEERKRNEENEDRKRRDERNYRVQRNLAVATFLAFLAAAYYAYIAKIQERDLADSIGVSQIIARQTRIQSAASAQSAEIAAKALRELQKTGNDTHELAVQAKRQSDISHSSLVNVQRAFMGFKEVRNERFQTPSQGGGSEGAWNFMLGWENAGYTAATDVVGAFNVKPMDDEPDDAEFEQAIVGSYSPAVVPSKGVFYSGTVGWKDNELFGMQFDDRRLGGKPFPKAILVYGYVLYRDIFNTKHLGEYCSVFERAFRNFDDTGKLVSWNIVLNGCKRHNCEDKRCPNYKAMIAKLPK